MGPSGSNPTAAGAGRPVLIWGPMILANGSISKTAPDGRPRWAVADDPRVTWLGRYLRKYRVDELPQFVNVIRGEMSLVGPRPERPEFVRKFRELTPYYDERQTLRPGVTGWAQVRYEYAGDMESGLRKLEYDLFYLKNMSLSLDCAIFLETVKTVLRGRGTN